jgi:translation initiation factor IF-1
MAKEELITFEGLVTELLPDARFAFSWIPGIRSSPIRPAR